MIDEEESNFYLTAMNFWTQYSQADEEIMSLARQGRVNEARAILEGECVDLYNSLSGAFNDIITYNTQGSDSAAEESASLYQTGRLFLLCHYTPDQNSHLRNGAGRHQNGGG